MLRADENEILTRVGPGTLMGDLLRRYWIPACLSSEIAEPDGPPIRVRLLGEDAETFEIHSCGKGAAGSGENRHADGRVFDLVEGGEESTEVRTT